MPLVLRLQKGSSLTNEELDANFVYIDGEVLDIQNDVATINNTTIPELESDFNALLLNKQTANAKLTSLSNLTSTGMLALSGTTVTPRTLIAGSTNIVITNGTGADGNPTVDINTTVLTTTGTQSVSNKFISGNNNNISSISLTQSVIGMLPIANGGSGASTAPGARTNLEVARAPTGVGLIAQIASDATVSRSITSSGVGVSIINSDGMSGNPTIVSNATSSNTASTIVARDASGNFTAGTITANLVGTASVATIATNGVVTTGTYANPAWITSLAGSKVTSIPNSSLVNPSVTINGSVVPLGGSITISSSGVSTNTAGAVVARDGFGNFSAGTITASLNGNATTSTSSVTAAQATRLSTPRTINGVAFDGTANITAPDNTKLPLTGGLLSGFVSLHANPTSAMHAANKQYVDSSALQVTYGTQLLNGTSTYGDVFPPAGRTMSSLKGFLPAFGSSASVSPIETTNLIVVIDVSGSATVTTTYNGVSYPTTYAAAVAAAKHLVTYYASRGTTNVCVVTASNTTTQLYQWISSAGAEAVLNLIPPGSGISGSVIQAYAAKPSTASNNVVYFLTDSTHSLTVGTVFGGSAATWHTFLDSNNIVSYAIQLVGSGLISNMDGIGWDGRAGVALNGVYVQTQTQLPTTVSSGVYSTGNITWGALSDRIRISLSNGGVSDVAVNWLALWG